MNFSKSDLERLANKIRREIFEPSSTFTKRIFLCGANPRDPRSIRGRIAEAIISTYYSILYQIVYPEDVFEELLYLRQSPDLLSLETLLIENVHAVVIIPESPGSFAELGAFVNNDRLRQKIVCVIDQRFKNDKSFINRGPVRLLKKEHPTRVLFIDPANTAKAGNDLRNIISTIHDPSASRSALNLFQIDNFLLPAIYLLEPVDRLVLIKLVERATEDPRNAYALTITSLTSLEKKKFIELNDSRYRLTRVGMESYFNIQGRGPIYRVLDDLRLDVFNIRYRDKISTL